MIEKKPALPAHVDEDLLKALQAATVGCEEVEGQARLNCQGGEKNAIVLSFTKGERNRAASLPTFAFALASSDRKLNALAAAVLYAAFRKDLGSNPKPDAIRSETATELLEIVSNLPDAEAAHAMPATTHSLMLTGQEAKLLDALKNSESTQVKTMAYRYMMVYGRLRAFEMIRELGSAPGTAVVLAAIESARNMNDWSAEEREAICPWAEPFLSDDRPAVSGNAAAVLGNCRGKHLDALLEHIEKLVEEHRFSFIHATALRDICSTQSEENETEAVSKTTCERVRRIQKTVALDQKTPARVRAMALSTMAHTWPDRDSYELASKLARESSADVAAAAKQIETRLASQFTEPN